MTGVDNSLDFAEQSRKIAQRFLRNVLLLDDRAFMQPATISGKKQPALEAPGPESVDGELSATGPVSPGAESLNAEELVRGFARLGLMCAPLVPNTDGTGGEDSFVSEVCEAAERADILVLDWWMSGNRNWSRPQLAEKVIKSIVERDQAAGGRLRLVAIYTGEPKTARILEKIRRLVQHRYAGCDLLPAGVPDEANVNWLSKGPFRLVVSTAKARTTIPIELSLAVLPEAAALLQPAERPLHHPSFRQHHESVQFVAFHHFHRGSQQALHRRGKGFPGVSPIHQHILHLAQVGPAPVKHSQSPSTVGNVGGGHVNRMGQPLSVHGDVALDSRHLLARVIALVLGAVGVLDALGVHDTEAGPFFPTIASPGRVNRFFLRPAPEWNTSPGRVARSIAGNTCSRCANPGSPQAASATGTRFSGDRAPRRKRRTGPRCGA